MTQPRPTGPPWPTSAEWKRKVLERMGEIGMSQADLARAIGVSDATTTDLFKEENKSSRVVPEVHAAIGWPPPPPPESVQGERDLLQAEILAAWPSLSDAERQAVIGVVRAVRRRYPP